MKLMIPEFMEAAMNDFVHPSIKYGEWHGIPIFYLGVLASMHVYPFAYDEEEHKLYLNYGSETITTTIVPDEEGYMNDSIKWFTTEFIKNHDTHEYVFSNEDGNYIPIFKNGCMEFFPKDPNNHAEEVTCLIDQIITLYKIIMDLGDMIRTLQSFKKEDKKDDLNTSNCSSDAENNDVTAPITPEEVKDAGDRYSANQSTKYTELIKSLSETNHDLIVKNRELDYKYNALIYKHEKLKEAAKDHDKILNKEFDDKYNELLKKHETLKKSVNDKIFADYEELKRDYNELSAKNAALTELNKKYEEKSAIQDKIEATYAKREELYNRFKDEYKGVTDAFADFLVNALNSKKDFKKTSNTIHSASSDINNDNKDDLVQAKTKSVEKTKNGKFVVYIKRSNIGIACLDDTTGCMYDPLDGSIISTDVNEENYTIFNINGCAVKFIKHLLNDLNGEDNDWK